MIGVASLVVIGVGVLVVLCGLYVSIKDWQDKRRAAEKKKGEIETEALGLAETLTALEKLAEALRGHTLGFQLIILGIVLILVGGVIGGVAAI